jgi:Fe-S cluster assembly scaffold IscU
MTSLNIIKHNYASAYNYVKRLYHSNVINHYENPKNIGSLDTNNPRVGTGLVGAPACGDVIRFQVEVNQEGKIIDAAFKTFGCGSAIAASSVATDWVKGKRIEDALKITNKEIASYLMLPPVKLHCSMLVEESIILSINDYKSKQTLL